MFKKEELEELSKTDLVELVLELQEIQKAYENK